jgi:Tfp pilus tip-associated adhesin PilY1
MLNKKRFISLIIILNLIVYLSASAAFVWADEEAPAGDEEATFISVAPDALIVLDLSGSMKFNPDGNETYLYGSGTACISDTTNCKSTRSVDCSGGFCESATSTCGVDCTRLAIAQRALFNILDNDNNNIINSADSDSLGIRIGFMRFKDIGDGQSGNDTAGDYTKGSIKLVTKISELGKETGTSYSLTYCGNSTSCSSTVASCSTGECIAGETYGGGTPLASALRETKKYLDDHKAQDPEKDCRQKFVVLVTDGADTFACPGTSCSNYECREGCGCECQPNMYKRRREVVAAAKALYNAGYKVFIIGFGSGMPVYLSNTLNWMAYYGGTDNTLTANSGNTAAYNIAFDSTSTYPAGVSSCSTDANETATCYSSGSSTNTDHFKASSNDPGYQSLSGYAFIASTSDELQRALAKAMLSIRASTYSYTQSSIQAVRTIDENYVYEASFEPIILDPFWIGHLKRFKIDDSGFITAAPDWDAGALLQSTAASSRNVLTSITTGVMQPFKTENTSITTAMLGASSADERTNIINFIRGGELDAAYPYYGWKLGDIFHASPLSIATPNSNYFDNNDAIQTFAGFRSNNERTVANGKRIIIVGANDGQLHAFKALDGSEVWSFIPPNLISELNDIVHDAHNTTLPDHKYFVDGPLSAADFYSSAAVISPATKKDPNWWKTILVMSEARGGIPTLWSSSANCISGFNQYYRQGGNTYGNYCGYYALDVTDTSSDPVLKWRLGGNDALPENVAAYLGQAWSKMYIGRVRIANTERWVGFIGGGYSGTNCAGATCDTRGKGFFVVDLSDGTILWQYTHADNGSMNYDLAAGPTVVDYDQDGFLDTAYIGDLGGNIWRFKFCLAGDDTSSSPCQCIAGSCPKWSGGLLFNNTTTDSYGNKSIYTVPVVAFDKRFNLWVYAGTGNKTDPTGAKSNGRLLSIKDSDRAKQSSTTYTLNNLTDASGNSLNCDVQGWYYNLTGVGEKILSEPAIFNKVLYFSTYIPAASSSACNVAGTSNVYYFDYLCGTGGKISVPVGGIPSSPVVSYNPNTKGYDIYVSLSEEAKKSTAVHTIKLNPGQDHTAIPAKTLLYWKDTRIQ